LKVIKKRKKKRKRKKNKNSNKKKKNKEKNKINSEENNYVEKKKCLTKRNKKV